MSHYPLCLCIVACSCHLSLCCHFFIPALPLHGWFVTVVRLCFHFLCEADRVPHVLPHCHYIHCAVGLVSLSCGCTCPPVLKGHTGAMLVLSCCWSVLMCCCWDRDGHTPSTMVSFQPPPQAAGCRVSAGAGGGGVFVCVCRERGLACFLEAPGFWKGGWRGAQWLGLVDWGGSMA